MSELPSYQSLHRDDVTEPATTGAWLYKLLVGVLIATIAILGLSLWNKGQWRAGQASTGTTAMCEIAGGHIVDIGPLAYHCAR